MIKNKSKLLLSGTIINALFAIYGIISIIFVFLQLVDIMPYTETTNVEMNLEMVHMGFVAMLVQIGEVVLGSFMILNGVLSIVGFVKNNKDFILTSIIMTGIIAVLSFIIATTYAIAIGLLIIFVAMLVGYIKDNKKTKKK